MSSPKRILADKYSRLRIISWWNQDKIINARFLVVGAGALGNEILKNLALLGAGRILVIDFDKVEATNLTRSVLFREQDVGKSKAHVAAQRATELNNDISIQAIDGNVLYEIGLGVIRRMDVVIGALDNREARLFINRCCYKVQTPWVDGGISIFEGVVRGFIPPRYPCYECTLTDEDYEAIKERRSCQLLKQRLPDTAVPTTPTISSIVGGLQVQEAIKIIHDPKGLHALNGSGYFINGLNFQSYLVDYSIKPDCLSHESWDEIDELPLKSKDLTLGDLVRIGKKKLGRKAILELNHEIVYELNCPNCGTTELPMRSMKHFDDLSITCSSCGKVKDIVLINNLDGSEGGLETSLGDVGLPLLDIYTARIADKRFYHFELSGDIEEMSILT